MKMKSSLPFKYITTVKDGKHYVVFDYKDNEGKRKRKWIGTDLPEKCAKKALNLKVEEIITAFLRDWLETIKPTIAETTYESYSQKLNSVVSYFDTVFPDITLAEVSADVLKAKKEQDEYLSTVLKADTITNMKITSAQISLEDLSRLTMLLTISQMLSRNTSCTRFREYRKCT